MRRITHVRATETMPTEILMLLGSSTGKGIQNRSVLQNEGRRSGMARPDLTVQRDVLLLLLRRRMRKGYREILCAG
jgi:hypothetical protein